MRTQIFLALFAIIACVFASKIDNEEETTHTKLQKYFHKKMCYCTKASSGICTSLKCCDVYQYVPYKLVVKMCKYGDCEFIQKNDEDEPDEEDEAIGGDKEDESGMSF